jgi:sirohydrochlorin cobaltochelatase
MSAPASSSGSQAGGRRALLLLGHGSHLSPDSSVPVYDHAATIRSTGLFDQVLEAFWKEEPSLRDAIDLVECEEVYIVPLFLAEGYFTRRVLPRELGLDGRVTHRAGRTIHYCAPIGTHPSMADLILARARSVAGIGPETRGRTTLVLVGHGTERSDTSADTVYRLVEAVRAAREFAEVTCGFLDEQPRIADVLGSLGGSPVVIVPFFVADGWHTSDTIPDELGLAGGSPGAGHPNLWYTPPVGTLPDVAGVILAIAGEAGAFRVPHASGEAGAAPTTPLPITAARRAFFDWLERGPRDHEFALLQVSIHRYPSGRFYLRHLADRGLAESLLRPLAGPPELLRLARRTASGAYRPLRTAADLRRGWQLRGLDDDGLWQALSLVYPAAVLHWYLAGVRALPVVNFPAWAARQSGAYESVGRLAGSSVEEVIDSCCGNCLKRRLWSVGGDTIVDAPVAKGPSHACVGCREPCTLFATHAREALEPEPVAAR